MADPTEPSTEDGRARPWEDLRESGLLWLINRALFHPLGYAIGLVLDGSCSPAGWCLLGDGRTPWRYADDVDEVGLWQAAQATLTPSQRGGGAPADVEALLANVRHSLDAAVDDAERAEAVEMLLSGWYAAWPATAVTDPHAPIAAELVRLLAPGSGGE